MKINRQNYIKNLLLILLLVFLAALSEILFVLKNPYKAVAYQFKAAQALAIIGQTELSLNFLEKSAWKKFELDKHLVNPPVNYPKAKIVLAENSELKRDINLYVSTLDYKVVSNSKQNDYSRVFYDLALLLDSHNESVLIPRFLLNTVHLNKEPVYWWLELANYFFKTGDSGMAYEVLKTCGNQNSDASKLLCKDFEDYIKQGGSPKEIGFMQNEVTDLYRQSP